MRIGATSDTHGKLPKVDNWPDLDLFIHAGDAAPGYAESDRALQHQWLPSFIEWLDAIPAKRKIYVPGNHDLFMLDDAVALSSSIQVLSHGRVDSLRLFGSAWTYWDESIFPPPWVFGADESRLEEKFAQIPADTEILVCHSGARGVLDNAPGRQVGSASLKSRLEGLTDLQLFIHGHAHESAVPQMTVGDALWINTAKRVITVEWSGDPNSLATYTLARFD